MNVVGKNRRFSSWMLIACGVWLVGLGFYFIALRPPLLPEDLHFMGTTAARIQIAAPGLEGWLKKVFTVMGGFMAGAGVLTVFRSFQNPTTDVVQRFPSSGMLTEDLLNVRLLNLRLPGRSRIRRIAADVRLPAYIVEIDLRLI